MKTEAKSDVERPEAPVWTARNNSIPSIGTWRTYNQPEREPESQRGDGSSLASADNVLRRSDTVPIPAKPPMLGPMSKEHTLPPKAKPGRKALPDNPNQDQRRKTQNRNSQRKFRDKRQQKLSDAEEAARKLQERVRELEGQQLRDRAEFREQVQRLERENQALRKESQDRRDSAEVSSWRDQQQVSTAPVVPVDAPPTPTYAETDFTNYRAGDQQRPSYGLLTDAHCGFCTDDGNCYCKQPPQHQQPRATDGGLLAVTSHPPRPGKCSDCLQNPARAAACQAIAKQAHSGPSRGSPAQKDSMMSCSTFMSNASGRHAQVPDLFRGQLHAHPTPNGGWETEERDAALALAALPHSDVKKGSK